MEFWIIVVLVSGLAFGIWRSRMLEVRVREEVVDARAYLAEASGPTPVYARPAGETLLPVSLKVFPARAMAAIDFDGDALFEGVDWFILEDETAAVQARRRDGGLEVYHEAGRTPPEGLFVAGTQRYATQLRARVEPGGAAELDFEDCRGRKITARLSDKEAPPRRPAFLLPVAFGAAQPEFFPFFFMRQFAFVAQEGGQAEATVDGAPLRVKKLPFRVNGRRVLLARMAADPLMCALCPAVETLETNPEAAGAEWLRRDGHAELKQLNAGGRAWLTFEPPLPDLAAFEPDAPWLGRFTLGDREAPGALAGGYQVRREGTDLLVELQPLAGWQPEPGVTWVRQYTWEARLTRAEDGWRAITKWNRAE